MYYYISISVSNISIVIVCHDYLWCLYKHSPFWFPVTGRSGTEGGGRDIFEAIGGPSRPVRSNFEIIKNKTVFWATHWVNYVASRCWRADSSAPASRSPAGSELPHRAVFSPSVTVKEGFLHKYKAEGPQLLSRFAFKKRYFWLTSETLSYAKSPDWQVGRHATPRLWLGITLLLRHSNL